jgi:hypothetical protein
MADNDNTRKGRSDKGAGQRGNTLPIEDVRKSIQSIRNGITNQIKAHPSEELNILSSQLRTPEMLNHDMFENSMTYATQVAEELTTTHINNLQVLTDEVKKYKAENPEHNAPLSAVYETAKNATSIEALNELIEKETKEITLKQMSIKTYQFEIKRRDASYQALEIIEEELASRKRKRAKTTTLSQDLM